MLKTRTIQSKGSVKLWLWQILIAFFLYPIWAPPQSIQGAEPTDSSSDAHYNRGADGYSADAPRPAAQIKKYPRAFFVLTSLALIPLASGVQWGSDGFEGIVGGDQYFQPSFARGPPRSIFV
ncbi:MAG: hypothetical protein AB1540_13985 [Bdellovibrionota bacterium]